MNRHFYGWMGRQLTVAAFLMLVCNGLNAKPISRAQALQQAAQFMKQQHDGRRLSPVSLAAAGTTTEDNCPYYAFNRGDGNGFVIIAGDDAVAERYYFDADGFLVKDRDKVGNYAINSDGAWIIDGNVQEISMGYPVKVPMSVNKNRQDSDSIAYFLTFGMLLTYLILVASLSKRD